MSGPTCATAERIRYPSPAPYARVYTDQSRRRNAVETGEDREALFLLEHTPTITLGRNAHDHHLLHARAELNDMGIDVVDVNRGGDVTYHGPGQLVAYPIVRLDTRGLSITQYLRTLEQTVINFLDAYGIAATRMDGFTGVWVDGAKVAAIGIGVHRNVSFHGLAINIDPDMDHWNLIVPCGIPDKPVTSLRVLLGQAPPMEHAMDALDKAFRECFEAGYPESKAQ